MWLHIARNLMGIRRSSLSLVSANILWLKHSSQTLISPKGYLFRLSCGTLPVGIVIRISTQKYNDILQGIFICLIKTHNTNQNVLQLRHTIVTNGWYFANDIQIIFFCLLIHCYMCFSLGIEVTMLWSDQATDRCPSQSWPLSSTHMCVIDLLTTCLEKSRYIDGTVWSIGN